MIKKIVLCTTLLINLLIITTACLQPTTSTEDYIQDEVVNEVEINQVPDKYICGFNSGNIGSGH